MVGKLQPEDGKAGWKVRRDLDSRILEGED